MNIPPKNNRNNRPHLDPDAILNATETAARRSEPNWSSAPAGSVYSPGRHNFSPPSGFSVTNEAVDYFSAQTGNRKSFRAAANLGLVVAGRVTIALGLGGVYTGINESAWPITLGSVGMAVGVGLVAAGAYRFYQDTSQFNHRLARASAVASAVGVVLATGGGVFFTWANKTDNRPALYTAVGIRTVGNVLLFGAMPTGFTSTEIVWGDCPIVNRVALRDGAYAHGVAVLMAWAHVSSPNPPAPLWAREALQCLGMALVSTGASLARTDMSRDQAKESRAQFTRRASTTRQSESPRTIQMTNLRNRTRTAQATGNANGQPSEPARTSPSQAEQAASGTGRRPHRRWQSFAAALLPAVLGRAEH